MEAMEKDFEDLVESEEVDQEEDEKLILDYFDDEGDLIAEDDSEEETEDSLIADDDTDDDEEDDTDTITSEEYELFIKEASDEEFDALPDEFFADIPDEFFEDVELTEEDLPEGETELQELKKKSLGKRIMARLKRKKWKRTSGGKASGRKSDIRQGKVARGAARVSKVLGRIRKRVARLYSEYDPEQTEDTEEISELKKKSLGARIQARLKKVKWGRTKGGKGYARKQKVRQKKVKAGGVRKDPLLTRLRKRVSKLYGKGESYVPTEDVDALLVGEEFSDEFRAKATTIFESAVEKRTEDIVKIELLVQQEEMVQEALEAFLDQEEEMTAKFDSYLDYIVEEWMEENKLAVEKGIKTEITETFLTGMKELFQTSYVEIPDDKVDVFSELTEKVSNLQDELDKQIQSNIELKEENNSHIQDDIFLTVSNNMVDVDVEKFKTLTESVVYSGDIEEYTAKLETIKESYFNETKEQSVQVLTEEADESTYGTSDPIMSAYAASLGRLTR